MEIMHAVWIAPPHRDLTGGVERIDAPGATVGQVIEALESRFPGLKRRLCLDDRLRPGIAVAVNGVVTPRGLRQRLDHPSEIHFIPAGAGGQ